MSTERTVATRRPSSVAIPVSPSVSRTLARALRHAALQRSPGELAQITCDYLVELTSATRADCVFYDAELGVLWREGSEMDFPATDALIGSVAIHGKPIALSRADGDPRYNPAADNPSGQGDDSIAFFPIKDGHGAVHGVLIIVRSGGAIFSPPELAVFSMFAQRISVIFEAIHLETVEDPAVEEAKSTKADRFFDPVALAAHREGNPYGDIIELPGLLPRAGYIAAVATFVLLLIFGGVARINRYAGGPAMLLSSNSTNVAAPVNGVVEASAVQRGDVVKAGQHLVYLRRDQERNDLSKAQREFDHRLTARLSQPEDSHLEAVVAGAAISLERARAALAERTLVAPRDGVVEDIPLIPGQAVTAGQTVIRLTPTQGTLRLRAAIPAHHRPTLAVGQPIRFELAGYPYTYLRMIVSAVGNRVLGPSEVRAVLGRDQGDTVTVEGPVVIVDGYVESKSFVFEGLTYDLHSGMIGKAEIKVADEPAILVLMPIIKRLLGSG